MRVANGILCLLMLLFAVAQYNDPDGLWWALIYAVPAAWAGVAAFRPRLLARPAAKPLWLVTLLAAALGVVWYWPPVDGWWRESVWWNVEEAREGMGMMIVVIVLLVAGSALLSHRGAPTARTSGSRPA